LAVEIVLYRSKLIADRPSNLNEGNSFPASALVLQSTNGDLEAFSQFPLRQVVRKAIWRWIVMLLKHVDAPRANRRGIAINMMGEFVLMPLPSLYTKL